MLEHEAKFYSSKIKRDFNNFIVESSIRRDCTMRKRYNQLLEKTLKKNYKNTCYYSTLPQFRYV
jgi:hypothetical protein